MTYKSGISQSLDQDSGHLTASFAAASNTVSVSGVLRSVQSMFPSPGLNAVRALNLDVQNHFCVEVSL